MNPETAVCTIPTELTKARKEDKVPLSARAVEVIQEARNLVGEDGDLVFPAGRQGKLLSNMAYTALSRRLEIPAVAHKFRGSFKDGRTEMYDGDGVWLLGETARAHYLGNATEAAYA